MKLFKIYTYTTVLAVVLFTSCNKFLDVTPKGEVIPTTLDDYLALMSAPLQIGRTSNNTHFITDEINLPDAYRAGATNYPGPGAIRAYDFEAELYDVSEEDEDWNVAYRTIYVANSVLSGIETNTESNQTKRNQAKGEALVHRAYSYLTLVNEYAKHYSATAETDMGVPLNLKVDINALPVRASVKTVYTQIEKDLLEAADILSEKSAYNYRPNKAGAFGVLARMYLYMGNWAKTAEYAGKALAINNFIYDYNDFKLANETKPQSSAITGYPPSLLNKQHIVLGKYSLKVGSYEYNYLFSDEQFGLFNPIPRDLTLPYEPYKVNDFRETYGSSPFGYSGKTFVGEGRGIKDTNGTYDYNNSGITTQELVLLRAEALARLNQTQSALDDLNMLRKKRIPTLKYVDLTAATPADALNLVLRERRIELAFSGLRLADIKRLNLEGRNISVTHGTKTLPANSPRFVLPIPSKVMSLNPNLIQNPR
ncbi:RagB/SusD family nutrient uptake outer membrane protein [Pedobacter nyackensis]|uniref:RagB/SusD family nutrient uptake outer membrane protein n=1 Tax=Pedobacter nyackensis TaxID=475255 RepID=UPI0029304676|nr:RagB/SusD family nutrient uptake outer membrane protein [Pedobacter nyackensis]